MYGAPRVKSSASGRSCDDCAKSLCLPPLPLVENKTDAPGGRVRCNVSARRKWRGKGETPYRLARYFIGSTGLLPRRSSKWSCGWLTEPLEPALAMVWPRCTASPRFTISELLWA